MTKLHTYTCAGFLPAVAGNIRAAAEIFANRAARKRYGRNGYCRTLNMEAHAVDCSVVEFSAFIGKTTGPGETTGHNVHLTVTRREGGSR